MRLIHKVKYNFDLGLCWIGNFLTRKGEFTLFFVRANRIEK
jgi:hypothetical protein